MSVAIGLAALGIVLLACAVELLLLTPLRRQKRLRTRIEAVSRPMSSRPNSEQAARGGLFAGWIGTIGFGIARSGLLSEATLASLNRTLGNSGLRGSSVLGIFVGTKLLLLLAAPLLAFAVLSHIDTSPLIRNATIAGAALFGLLGPDWWIRRRHRKYIDAVQAGLADALDLLVICAEAGLAFEPAIYRVATEIRPAHPAISEEFALTANELRVVADSRAALTNMGTRTGLESIKRMASVLIQTMRYGTPLSEALRVLSTELRHETLMRFETRAARLPVLLTIPMILFILPCIFLIVGGPAAIQVMNSFR